MVGRDLIGSVGTDETIQLNPAGSPHFALLDCGAHAHGRVLEPESLELMYRPAYQPDPRLPGMGLGFFRARIGGRRVVEHQGVHPGFHSHLCLAPDDGE